MQTIISSDNTGWENPKFLEKCKECNNRKLNLCTKKRVKIFYYQSILMKYMKIKINVKTFNK